MAAESNGYQTSGLTIRHIPAFIKFTEHNDADFQRNNLTIHKYTQCESDQQILEFLYAQNTIVLAVMQDEIMVACGALEEFTINYEPLNGLWYGVNQEQRRMGLATNLCQNLLDCLPNMPAPNNRLIVFSNPENTASLVIARKLNFVRAPELDYKLNGSLLVALSLKMSNTEKNHHHQLIMSNKKENS